MKYLKGVYMNYEKGKKHAAKAAASFVKNNMTVGIGTGSTVVYLIEELISKKREGMRFKVIASSEQSSAQAHQGGLEFINEKQCHDIDMTIDGADQIDIQKRMIKGGGGALMREKLLAYSSKEVVIIVDESKYTKTLQNHKLPLEILPFGHVLTIARLKERGYQGALRTRLNGDFFCTDNGNMIFDIQFNGVIENPEEHDKKLQEIPGVLETGFFFNLAKKVIIGYENGKVEMR